MGKRIWMAALVACIAWPGRAGAAEVLGTGVADTPSDFYLALDAAVGYAYIENYPVHLDRISATHHLRMHGAVIDLSAAAMWGVGEENSTHIGIRLQGQVMPRLDDRDHGDQFHGTLGGASLGVMVAGRYLWAGAGFNISHLSLWQSEERAYLGEMGSPVKVGLLLDAGGTVPLTRYLDLRLGARVNWLLWDAVAVAGLAGLRVKL